MAESERTPNGRFAKGNPGGPGNPHARKVAALRSALIGAVSEQDVAAIVRALVEKAKGGDVAAVKELLSRTLGPAEALDVLQRLEAVEEAMRSMGRGGCP